MQLCVSPWGWTTSMSKNTVLKIMVYFWNVFRIAGKIITSETVSEFGVIHFFWFFENVFVYAKFWNDYSSSIRIQPVRLGAIQVLRVTSSLKLCLCNYFGRSRIIRYCVSLLLISWLIVLKVGRKEYNNVCRGPSGSGYIDRSPELTKAMFWNSLIYLKLIIVHSPLFCNVFFHTAVFWLKPLQI